MSQRIEYNIWDNTSEILGRMHEKGVLCVVCDRSLSSNIITLGWGLIGPSYHGHPVCAIAITPQRYSWGLLEEVPEFVIAVPDDSLKEAVHLCGTQSGRDTDKWKAAGLTPVPSRSVRPPSIRECPINIECRIYTKVAPPHFLLTPEHRKASVDRQHTIYFAEVLGAYGWDGS